MAIHDINIVVGTLAIVALVLTTIYIIRKSKNKRATAIGLVMAYAFLGLIILIFTWRIG